MAVLDRLSFLLKSARPGFWPTTVWFYLLPIGQQPVLHSPHFWLGLVYVTLPIGLTIYGWNDLSDVATDRLNPRKDTFLFGARGHAEQRRQLPYAIVFVQLVFTAGLYSILGARIVLWLIAMIGINAIYNWPRWGFKRYPIVDLLCQPGYLLIFTFSSWINAVPLLSLPAYVFGGLFAMHSHLFGQIIDIEPDRIAGRRTTACLTGVTGAKYVLASLLTLEAGIVWLSFHSVLIASALLIAAVVFVIDAVAFSRSRPYNTAESQRLFVAWNVLALCSMGWVWQSGIFN